MIEEDLAKPTELILVMKRRQEKNIWQERIEGCLDG